MGTVKHKADCGSFHSWCLRVCVCVQYEYLCTCVHMCDTHSHEMRHPFSQALLMSVPLNRLAFPSDHLSDTADLLMNLLSTLPELPPPERQSSGEANSHLGLS